MDNMNKTIFPTSITRKFNDDIYLSYYDQKVKRSTIKQLGGKVIARSGNNEIRYELWLVQSKNDDTYWIGDNWYSDKYAWVYKAFKSPF